MRELLSSARAAQPARRNPARTRERILGAAFREFAAKGFAGARVDAIARNASINKRMLYHYFGDKNGLFREVLRRKMAERKARVVLVDDYPQVLAALGRLLRTYCDVVASVSSGVEAIDAVSRLRPDVAPRPACARSRL